MGPGYLHHLLLTFGGHHWRPVQTWFTWGPPHTPQYWHLVVATKNTWSWQAGGTHPTGMLSCYRPQTKFAKVMFLQVSVCPQGGACVVALGGCAWLLWGTCVVAPGGGTCVVASGGHAWLLWGRACVVAPGGACVVAPRGACVVFGGGAWFFRWDTGQWAGGTHPTGMHSCVNCEYNFITTRKVHLPFRQSDVLGMSIST